MRWLWSIVTTRHNGGASQVSITANGEKGHWVSRQQKPLKKQKGDKVKFSMWLSSEFLEGKIKRNEERRRSLQKITVKKILKKRAATQDGRGREGRGHPLRRFCCGTTVQVINTLSVNFIGGWAGLLRRACGTAEVLQGDALSSSTPCCHQGLTSMPPRVLHHHRVAKRLCLVDHLAEIFVPSCELGTDRQLSEFYSKEGGRRRRR